MILDMVIVRRDEDMSGLIRSLDMLAMQRKVNFDDFMVTFVQIGSGKQIKLDKEYPFRVKSLFYKTDSIAETYTRCISLSPAQWIMFMDYGDMMSDVYSLNVVLDLMPTEEFDILWLQYYAEFTHKNVIFVNVKANEDSEIYAKLFRVDYLKKHDMSFDKTVNDGFGRVFLAEAQSVTDYTRYAKIGTKFIPYIHIVNRQQVIPENVIVRNKYEEKWAIIRNVGKHTHGLYYFVAKMNAICTAYYLLHMKNYPGVTDKIHRDALSLYKQNKGMIDNAKQDDLEIFLDDAYNEVQSLIQNAYNNFGHEMFIDCEYEPFQEWVRNGCKPYMPPTKNATMPKKTPEKRIRTVKEDKVAVFCGTRNVYNSMETAAKSLVYHTPMDRVYFLIEDDEFPNQLPDNFIVINVSGQKYFDPHGKNYNNAWTYMCMMRAAFTKLFPDEHKVLSLDIDVIVNQNISELWDIDMTNYYIAGVPETEKTEKNKTPYVNFGVIMMNLDKIRENHMDDTIIDSLNKSRWGCPEQDAFNHFCSGEIYALPNMYNITRAGSITGDSVVEKISHYAGIKYWKHYKPFQMYAATSWDDITGKAQNAKPIQDNVQNTKPVLFASFRPLDRSENLKAIYEAYPGPKLHICTTDDNFKAEVQSGKYDLMVTDEFPTVTPGKCIMIWHGIQGGKTIGIDQPNPYYNLGLTKLMTRIVTPGTGTISMWHKCTGVPERNILPLGMPRTDEYFDKQKGDGSTVLAQKTAYLYVPTFRTSNETPLPDIDWDLIDNELTDEELFVVKVHPMTDMGLKKQYRHILQIPNTEPTTPYLIDCDAVVTDYSSVMFDAYLMGKPVILFEKRKGYTETRGMYLEYPDQYCSRYAINELGMITLLRTAQGLTDVERKCLSIVADKCDGHSCERVCKLIDELNKGGDE